MYQPTAVLLTILELLQARPIMSGAELARRLEVDRRTVRRYIVMLQDLGIPVEATRGKYGGYRLRPGFKLPPLLFTEEEALAVTLGLLAARRIGLKVTAPATEGALAKIERVLPDGVSARLQALQDSIAFTETLARSGPLSGDTLLVLSDGAHRRQRVSMRYRGARNEETTRAFDPYGLVYHYGRWYAVGLDHQSGEVRTFRIDRIASAELAGDSFERPSGFDAVRELQRSMASIPWGIEMEVLLHTTIEEARARVPANYASLEDTPDGVLLRAQTDDPRGGARTLVWLGFPFTIHHPDELREALRELAEEMLAVAG